MIYAVRTITSVRIYAVGDEAGALYLRAIPPFILANLCYFKRMAAPGSVIPGKIVLVR
jgi:hypothetical protein